MAARNPGGKKRAKGFGPAIFSSQFTYSPIWQTKRKRDYSSKIGFWALFEVLD